jgi:hypothetical protein
MLALLDLCTPRAALEQLGWSREDCSDWDGCYPDHPHHGGSRQQIGTCAHRLPLG